MELAGAQINANERSGGRGARVSGLRCELSDKRLSHGGERPARRPPGPGAHLPAPPPLSQPWGQPRLRPREGVGQDGTDSRGGQKSPQQLVEGNAQLWGRGAEDTVWGRPEPHVSLPAHPSGPHSTPTPAPSPQALAQGPEVGGRPPLVVCLEGRGEGEAQSGPGGGPDRELHHSCLRVFQP